MYLLCRRLIKTSDIMSYQCIKCSDLLSGREVRECMDEASCSVEWMCDDCRFDLENQDHSMDYEQHSDADTGL